MEVNDKFYRFFLEEVNSLEKFRMTYSGLHSADLLGREDPDVKRLIEALAFYNVRTRLSSLRNIQATRRRLFEQYFSFLLDPLPAMGILQAEIAGRFTEPTMVPKNSEVAISADGKSYAYFRTMNDLKILPIYLARVEMLPLPKEGFRFVLHFQTPYPRNDKIGELPVYFNYLNNYHASLQFRNTLRRNLKKVSVSFDERVDENTEGIPSSLVFGRQKDDFETTNIELSHPLQKIRTFFHFPQQELYGTFRIPTPARNWSHFAVCLDVNKNWPKNLTINRDIFQLFTVPIINLKNSMSQPIVCDGMQDRYPIRYGDVGGKFSLHSVVGVYRIEEEGFVPLRSGIIAAGSGTYEIEKAVNNTGRTITWLSVNFPGTFENPRKLVADALWHQPWFSEVSTSSELETTLYSRSIEGVSWDLVGELCTHKENPLGDDSEGLLNILSLQKKPILRLEEILCMLNALGVVDRSPFKVVPQLLEKMSVTVVPESKKGGIKHVYQAELREFDNSYRPLVELFLSQLVRLIGACSAGANVALKAKIPSTGELLQFE